MDESIETQYSLRAFLQRYETLMQEYVDRYPQSDWSLGTAHMAYMVLQNYPHGVTPRTLLARVRDLITTINFNTPSPFPQRVTDMGMGTKLGVLIFQTRQTMRYHMINLELRGEQASAELALLEKIRRLCNEARDRFWDIDGIVILQSVDVLTPKLNPAVLSSVSALIGSIINQQKSLLVY